MIRVLEVLVSILIVFLLAVIIGVFLPDSGHVERSVEVSNPVRQVYDSVNTFRRFPEWSALRANDPQVKFDLSGPESGVGARVGWTSADPKLGNGTLTIASSEPDSEVKMAVENEWSGTDKTYTVTLTPSANGRTVTIKWAYDVKYGWNLLWRYAGLYIHGLPDRLVQDSLGNLSNTLATFPNADYRDQAISVVDVTARPVLLIRAKVPRSLDEIAIATDEAVAKIDAVIQKAGLQKAGPLTTITTSWGNENYVFDVAVPVSGDTFTLDGKEFKIAAAPEPNAEAEVEDADAADAAPVPEDGAVPEGPKVYLPGDIDERGYLVITDTIRGTLSYGGKALVTDYTGNPAALPLLRLMERAYAETHGYAYSEMGTGRPYDELISDPAVTPQDEQVLKVYLPVTID
ncbi:SRPBCC family protein [Dokdonella koreensis]|uniref:Polyketide cyclase/dehydrase and lipid transport n=1 Tax=Dokdonella koreensis DS-123 TaxID=1300342 RepID=A0A160DT79_9GAMM|nr:SRPBCC family protein [Dokdonella koreensis]ANB17557.1 Polyketide cyclase/dehydrase and lipid transport [Dokdonella koreensis DS-123]